MNTYEKINELDRLLSNIIRIGTLAQIDFSVNKARVKMGELLSGWLPVLSVRAGTLRSYSPPTVNEQVILLAPGGNLSGAVILRGLYQSRFPAPSNSEKLHTLVFLDGTELSYDEDTRTLSGTVKGDVQLHVDGNVKIVTEKQVQITATAGVTITGNLTVNGGITSTGDQTAGSISQMNHTHPDALCGATGKPQ